MLLSLIRRGRGANAACCSITITPLPSSAEAPPPPLRERMIASSDLFAPKRVLANIAALDVPRIGLTEEEVVVPSMVPFALAPSSALSSSPSLPPEEAAAVFAAVLPRPLLLVALGGRHEPSWTIGPKEGESTPPRCCS